MDLSFFCFPLFLAKSKSISHFAFLDQNFSSLCSVLEFLADLVRPSLVVFPVRCSVTGGIS